VIEKVPKIVPNRYRKYHHDFKNCSQIFPMKETASGKKTQAIFIFENSKFL